MYNEGISKVGDILDLAVAENIVDKRGAFYSYGDTRLAQGRENAKRFLQENPKLTLEIENQVRQKFSLPLRDEATAYYGVVNARSGRESSSEERVKVEDD